MFLSYLVGTMTALGLAAIGTALIVRWGFRKKPSAERMQDIHPHPLSRYGGLPVVAAFIIAVLLHNDLTLTRDGWALIFGLGVVLVGGLIDDHREQGPFFQAFLQVMAIVLFMWLGRIQLDVIHNPFGGEILLPGLWGILVAGAWMLVILNAINWLDGLDGLGAMILIIGFVVLGVVSLMPNVNQPPLAILAFTAAGALSGFLIYNIPPALVLMGSAGAYGMAFVLGGLSVFSGGKMATAAIVLGIPLLDAIWVLWQRVSSRVPLAKGDRRHLHHAFLRAGFSPAQIVAVYGIITSLFAVVSIMLVGPWRIVAAGVVVVSFFILLTYVGRVLRRKTLIDDHD